MKIWLNFEEEKIKERKDGWSEGDMFGDQLIFEEQQDMDNCYIEMMGSKIRINFNNGYLEIHKSEIGSLF